MNEFCEPITVSDLPYTAPKSGILQIYIAANGANMSYYYVRIAGRVARLQTNTGGATTGSFPVRKGETVTFEDSENIETMKKSL